MSKDPTTLSIDDDEALDQRVREAIDSLCAEFEIEWDDCVTTVMSLHSESGPKALENMNSTLELLSGDAEITLRPGKKQPPWRRR